MKFNFCRYIVVVSQFVDVDEELGVDVNMSQAGPSQT